MLTTLISWYRRICFKWTNRHCPICKWNVKKFLPLDEQYSKVQVVLENRNITAFDYETLSVNDYYCPICWSNDRARLIYKYLSEKFGDNAKIPSSIAHFAPDWGLNRAIKRRFPLSKLVTLDLFMDGVDVKADLQDLRSINTGEFDIVICSHVLEHVPDDMKALSEISRILNVSWIGIFLVPIPLGLDSIHEDPTESNPDERLRRFGQDDHIRMYSKKGFMDRLSTYFNVHQLWIDDFGIETFTRLWLKKESILYVCTGLEKTRKDHE